MTIPNGNNLTLADWAKRIDPDGKEAVVVNLLSQNNEILQDMMWQPGNLPTGNETTQRTSLPTLIGVLKPRYRNQQINHSTDR